MTAVPQTPESPALSETRLEEIGKDVLDDLRKMADVMVRHGPIALSARKAVNRGVTVRILANEYERLIDDNTRLQSALTAARAEREKPDDMECPCGKAIRRNGETVKSHWDGSICEDCEADIWRKHPANRSAKAVEAAALLDKEADLMAAWLREMADDASVSDEDSGSLMAAASLIQKLRSRPLEGQRDAE